MAPYLIEVSRRSAQATAGTGLAQGPYVAERAGVEPTTLRLKVIVSTKAPPRPTTLELIENFCNWWASKNLSGPGHPRPSARHCTYRTHQTPIHSGVQKGVPRVRRPRASRLGHPMREIFL